MSTLRALSVTALISLTLPLFASAVSLQELQVQVARLMQQLSVVQSQQGSTQSSTPQQKQTTTPAQCPTLTRTLSRSMKGADVTQLQNFLISQNHLAAGNNTGLFGVLTEAAVKRFQCTQNIVCSGAPASTGYGSVGARTRAAITQSCSGKKVTITSGITYTQSTYYSQSSYVSCVPLAQETRTQRCSTGQSGSITQVRTSSCAPGATEPRWGEWVTTSGTCVPIPAADTVSIKDFGAQCDALENPSSVNGGNATGNDDFPAFVAAVAALPENGGTVMVPVFGTGKCLWKKQQGANPSLRLPSNVTLKMDTGVRILVEGTPNGVNGYTNGSIRNAHMSGGGDSNVNVIGGSFKAAGPYHGSVFVAFKHVHGGKIHTTFLDNNSSARAQVAFSDNIDVNITVGYEHGPWAKVIQPGNSSLWSFEDGFRVGSGSWNIRIRGDIHSGDDAIALNNEWSETESSNAGADIHDISVDPSTVSTQAGNVVRIYQQKEMTTGKTYNVFVNGLNGTPKSAGSGASGISIADYSNRRAISDVNFSGMSLNVHGVSGENAAGVSLVNTERVKFTDFEILGATGYGVAVADGLNSEFRNVKVTGNNGSIDGFIFGPYVVTGSGGSSGLIAGGTIDGFGRGKAHIAEGSSVAVTGI